MSFLRIAFVKIKHLQLTKRYSRLQLIHKTEMNAQSSQKDGNENQVKMSLIVTRHCDRFHNSFAHCIDINFFFFGENEVFVSL